MGTIITSSRTTLDIAFDLARASSDSGARASAAFVLWVNLYHLLSTLDYTTKGVIEVPLGTNGATEHVEKRGHPDPYAALVEHLHQKNFPQRLATEKLVRPTYWCCLENHILVPYARVDALGTLWTFEDDASGRENYKNSFERFQGYLLANLEHALLDKTYK